MHFNYKHFYQLQILLNKYNLYFCIPTISSGSGFFNPIGKMTDKVKEEISFGNWYYFIGNFHKQTETLAGPQCQPLWDIRTEIFCSRWRVYFKSFISIIREENFVKYLSGLVLNSLHFNLMRWIFSLTVPYSFLQALQRILRYRMTSCTQK